MTHPTIFPFGEAAVVCEFAAPAVLEVQARIWAVAKEARGWAHVTEVVTGVHNLTLLFDPLSSDADTLAAKLGHAFERHQKAAPPQRPLIEIPVHYGGENGPDLNEVAQLTGLTPEQVVERHCAGEYIVFCLGFMPGFAYLGGLDESIHTPRRATPRQRVPAGSVGIGGAQTGVYPFAAPGGWQLIGRTEPPVFDPFRDPPALMQPGDRVRFIDAGRAA